MEFYTSMQDDYVDYSKKNFQRTLLAHLSKNGVAVINQLSAENAIDSFFNNDEWEKK